MFARFALVFIAIYVFSLVIYQFVGKSKSGVTTEEYTFTQEQLRLYEQAQDRPADLGDVVSTVSAVAQHVEFAMVLFPEGFELDTTSSHDTLGELARASIDLYLKNKYSVSQPKREDNKDDWLKMTDDLTTIKRVFRDKAFEKLVQDKLAQWELTEEQEKKIAELLKDEIRQVEKQHDLWVHAAASEGFEEQSRQVAKSIKQKIMKKNNKAFKDIAPIQAVNVNMLRQEFYTDPDEASDYRLVLTSAASPWDQSSVYQK